MWCRATFNHKVSKKDSLNLYNLPNSKLSSAWSHLNLIELICRISLGPIWIFRCDQSLQFWIGRLDFFTVYIKVIFFIIIITHSNAHLFCIINSVGPYVAHYVLTTLGHRTELELRIEHLFSPLCIHSFYCTAQLEDGPNLLKYQLKTIVQRNNLSGVVRKFGVVHSKKNIFADNLLAPMSSKMSTSFFLQSKRN